MSMKTTRLHTSHPVIDKNLAAIREKCLTQTINAIGKEYGIDKATMSRYAKIYNLKGLEMKVALSLKWTDSMIATLKAKFPTTFNKTLAEELKVSPRSLIRKARELNISKEEGFLDKNRATISRMASQARPKNSPETIARITQQGIPYRFKKGEKRKHTINYSKVWETRRRNNKGYGAKRATDPPQVGNFDYKQPVY